MKRIDDTIISVPASLISPDPAQPRVEADAELTSSIIERGQLEPIHVRENPHEPGHYTIINGERRWNAIRSIGEDAPVDVLVFEVGPAAQLFLDQLVSNVARRQLTLTEEIRALKRSNELGFCPETIAKALGVSVSTVEADLPIADLPDKVSKAAPDAGLPKTVLRQIANHGDPVKAVKAARKAQGKGVTQMLAQVDHLTAKQQGEDKEVKGDPDAGKALSRFRRQVKKFMADVDIDEAVAARSGKTEEWKSLAGRLHKLATEIEKAAAAVEAKKAA